MPPRVNHKVSFPPSILPVGDGDRKVPLQAGRSPDLPDLYKAAVHPLHWGSGRAYYFIQNGSSEAMIEAYRYEDSITSFPQDDEASAINEGVSVMLRTWCNIIQHALSGYFKLVPGDTLFQRKMTASSSGDDDVVVFYVVGGSVSFIFTLSVSHFRAATSLVILSAIELPKCNSGF